MNAPDANDLLLFVRVVDTGSFTLAAQRLGLPKSTVSRRIARLEKQLGERLLQRTTRQIQLTDFGHGLLPHAREVAQGADDAWSLAAHRQQRPSGRLRVSMPGDMAVHAFPQALARFVRDYPEVTLDLDLSPRRVDLIGENFDLAVRMGDLPDDASLAARRLALFTHGLYAAPMYLRGFPGLNDPEVLRSMHGLVIRPRDDEPGVWPLHNASDGRRWQGLTGTQTRANSPDLLLRLALLGAGVTAITDFFAEAHLRTGTLARLLPEWSLPPVAAWAVFPGRRLMPLRTRLFIDVLADALAPCRHVEPAAPAVADPH